jgi:tetratricopeptide (TPR) repeat protein
MPRNRLIAALFAVALFLPAAALAQPGARPWEAARALLNSAIVKIRAGGVLGLAADAPAMETALASAPKQQGTIVGDHVYLLSDGGAQALILLAGAATKESPYAGRAVTAVDDPYPTISFLLGSYYDEVGKPAEALRLLDAGLALPSQGGPVPGLHRPLLVSERGAALVSLHRWADALADYDGGLTLSGLDPRTRARLLRGRGMALTELGRLDEAEAAYHQSMTFDPNNPIALQELAYIASQRAGAPRSDSALRSVQPPK